MPQASYSVYAVLEFLLLICLRSYVKDGILKSQITLQQHVEHFDDLISDDVSFQLVNHLTDRYFV